MLQISLKLFFRVNSILFQLYLGLVSGLFLNGRRWTDLVKIRIWSISPQDTLYRSHSRCTQLFIIFVWPYHHQLTLDCCSRWWKFDQTLPLSCCFALPRRTLERFFYQIQDTIRTNLHKLTKNDQEFQQWRWLWLDSFRFMSCFIALNFARNLVWHVKCVT